MTATGFAHQFLLAFAVSVSCSNAADWRALHASGVEKLGQRRLPEARRDLRAALEAAETVPAAGGQRAQILHDLGRVEFQMGNLRPAIAYHERALALLPPADRAADLFNIAQAWRELGDAREAERSARSALAMSADDPRILRLLASILIQRRQYPEAETVAQRALAKADPAMTAMIWSDLAVIAEARGRYAPAVDMLRRAIEGMPASQARGRAFYNLSYLEQRLKRHPEAVSHARQAVAELEEHAGRQHPDLCRALERHAEALRQAGRQGEAEPVAQRARQLQSLLSATVDWRSVQ